MYKFSGFQWPHWSWEDTFIALKRKSVSVPTGGICSLLEPPEMPKPHSVSVESPTPDVLCEQSLWWLASHNGQNMLVVLTCWSMYQYCLWLKNIFYAYVPFYMLFIRWMYVWLFCKLWLLGIMLLWPFIHKLLCKHMFSIWGSFYQIVALQSHMVTLCYQIFWETGQLFPELTSSFQNLTSNV